MSVSKDIQDQIIADIRLSGDELIIGHNHSATDEHIWFKTKGMGEETYISVAEAKLIIAAFNVAIDELSILGPYTK